MIHDEGFSFRLGVFETMLIHNGRVIMLDAHLERLNRGLDILGISNNIGKTEISDAVSDGNLDGMVLKVEVSERNIIFSHRPVPYSEDDYSRGFKLKTSMVRRNETSPFTYIKSLQCGDNIIEKRRVKAEGHDEPIFLNSHSEICEGATTNIFFVSENRILTPDENCGLLPGTVRRYLLDRYDVKTLNIGYDEIDTFDECFVTNSVLGIMPVISLDDTIFHKRDVSNLIRRRYLKDIEYKL